MRVLALATAFFATFVYPRVTFPYSEVLQAPDLVFNVANFKCKNQCKVYVDRKYNLLMVTQNGNLIANFNTIVSGDVFAPTGIVLPAGDYTLENRGEKNPEFVFYVVDSKAPNYDTPVRVPQDTIGISIYDKNRFVTILSSFEAMWWSGFSGTFPAGYPSIYATGFDAAGDAQCHPVYQARSQYNAEVSWPTIATALQTVDFGFVGEHHASVNYRTINDPPKSAGESTVYTSPGYVGCSTTIGQNYHSTLNQVSDKFTLAADSLDVNAVYSGLTAGEPLQFSVTLNTNVAKVSLVGSDAYTAHNSKGTYNVDLSWVRKTPGSNFAMQIDFGNDNAHNLPTNFQSTTKMGRSLNALFAIALIIVACLWA